ncbi:hypothetical protein [Nonlabens sp. YIK11]|uniref:hypothetical protein n=1 Tax=Nonlabens sp. YIK11 TaxID=1453349 RepID=UPI0006DC1050|nr:hypothetical protein [Nonlabens sp. YIK11]
MKYLNLLLICLFLISCKNDTSSTVVDDTENNELQSDTANDETQQDDNVAQVADFLKTDFLKDELSYMTENDRQFQLVTMDLNGDDQDEYFVYFNSPYFCGSGGCTAVLLDSDMKVLTRFTVVQTPVIIRQEAVNGYLPIIVYSDNSYRQLTYADGTYPTNPSMIESFEYEKQEGDQVIFDNDLQSKATYPF